eukprot:4805725-Alexandrium_andersonii.AAC.1
MRDPSMATAASWVPEFRIWDRLTNGFARNGQLWPDHKYSVLPLTQLMGRGGMSTWRRSLAP